MKMTQALKAWLVKNMSIAPDASDDEFRKAAGEAFANGTLTAKDYTELTKDAKADEANQFAEKMDRIADGLGKLTEMLAAKASSPDEDEDDDEEEEEVAKDKATKTVTKEAKTTKQPSRLTKMFMGTGTGSVEGDIDVRVKEAAEMYGDTKSAMVYPTHNRNNKAIAMAGQPVKEWGRQLNNPSDRDTAVVGAWAKFMCQTARTKSRNLAWMGMKEHDRELILYAMENMTWGGASDGGDYHDINNRKLTQLEQKALIDDAVSGGTEAVPTVFDDMIVTTPILNGEFYPLVNEVPLDKGRLVNGAAAGTVTSSWGGVDDTEITLFDTASYVTSFDTTIFRWEGCVRIGLDFLSDTPIDFGQHFTTQYGEVLLRQLDLVVCIGNGTTQPEGVMTKAGTTSVAFGGATSIGNYESLRFGVHKREHRSNLMSSIVFGGTDTSYQRAMAIPVGASDARRLSNTSNMPNYDGYTWMNRPYKISADMTNSQIFYAVLGRYRMYRRRGLTVKTSTEGDTLIRRNELLIAVTARYGGQLERGACAAVTTTAPA